MNHAMLIRILKTAALLGATLLTSACSMSPTSPLDQALYTSGKGLGGYSRTIFSSNDF